MIRDTINSDKEWILDKFVEKYRDDLTQDDIEIVLSWKEQIKGAFFIVKQLKKYAKLLIAKDGENRAYGVYALNDSFDELFDIPTWIDTVLLPFKDKIIYDGLILARNIHFGKNIRKNLNDDLGEAEAKYGLIVTLPYVEASNGDEKLLQFYAKSETNRDYYEDEIIKIISKSEELKQLYYREVGKANARAISKSLRLAGMSSGYFAIIDNVIVASGVTKKEVEKNIKAIVPKDRLGYVYVYQLKKKR
ncbi:hypothetical protein MNB_SV-12-364 [hydrothermal vent metagenome]|uniref:Uncharacterized protein n=1 Tax=hydrothermal vent metagenome TaxID=652676 RepID=A0A1W1C411_9ZZZZ